MINDMEMIISVGSDGGSLAMSDVASINLEFDAVDSSPGLKVRTVAGFLQLESI